MKAPASAPLADRPVRRPASPPLVRRFSGSSGRVDAVVLAQNRGRPSASASRRETAYASASVRRRRRIRELLLRRASGWPDACRRRAAHARSSPLPRRARRARPPPRHRPTLRPTPQAGVNLPPLRRARERARDRARPAIRPSRTAPLRHDAELGGRTESQAGRGRAEVSVALPTEDDASAPLADRKLATSSHRRLG